MATYSNLAVKLLRDTARFVRDMGNENAHVKEQMGDNAEIFEIAANLLESDPLAKIDAEAALEKGITTASNLAAKLLRDAAAFFRGVGKDNIYIKEQMDDNAVFYERIANLLESDPLAEIDMEENG